MKQEMMGFGDGSGTSWTICKHSVPRTRQIITPTPHHSIFTGRMLFLPDAQPTVSKHWRLKRHMYPLFNCACLLELQLLCRHMACSFSTRSRVCLTTGVYILNPNRIRIRIRLILKQRWPGEMSGGKCTGTRWQSGCTWTQCLHWELGQ